MVHGMKYVRSLATAHTILPNFQFPLIRIQLTHANCACGYIIINNQHITEKDIKKTGYT